MPAASGGRRDAHPFVRTPVHPVSPDGWFPATPVRAPADLHLGSGELASDTVSVCKAKAFPAQAVEVAPPNATATHKRSSRHRLFRVCGLGFRAIWPQPCRSEVRVWRIRLRPSLAPPHDPPAPPANWPPGPPPAGSRPPGGPPLSRKEPAPAAAEPTAVPSQSPCSGSRRHACTPRAHCLPCTPPPQQPDPSPGQARFRLYTYSPTTHTAWTVGQTFTFLKPAEGDTIYYLSGPRTTTFPYNVGRFFISAHTILWTWRNFRSPGPVTAAASLPPHRRRASSQLSNPPVPYHPAWARPGEESSFNQSTQARWATGRLRPTENTSPQAYLSHAPLQAPGAAGSLDGEV
ncbi:hypothetical protein N7523_000028 [Penicillium sp. IBT 18751x]|nr:hypothetical protein N7523_000004 [Penicillium sp. IBT 18751x]KAJ6133686.1 hypothetical protein N7523_000008 [Penicillium sp. IBT 18751x]KAJ6133690.1 hypothetical protein N7523_000012 [Penicillium sp. IBT 18751x]KAJ6133694.1 hypothetical protein N7523_000016 [Penicillium sp. IBT 18751x]KAJ6133698.1 hypothetical protein N7523_000020 [Penicillium sp. IBT 18751x]